MKFQITIKQQSEAINGKAKYPLYKPSNDKNCEEDHGLEALEQLMQSSSIKIFCDECQKQITFETIVIAYEGQEKVLAQKQNEQSFRQKPIVSEERGSVQQEKSKNKAVEVKLSKLNITKLAKQQKQQQDELFEQDSSQQENNDEISSDSEVQKKKQQHVIEVQQTLGEKQNEGANQKMKEKREITHLYCVGCFACLEEFPIFYSIRKSLKFSPLNSSWNVYDEINLLNGLKFWGFGNWGQIKEFMDYNSSLFTASQIEEHYESLYLKGEGPIFPKSEQFDMNKAHKPAKRYLQDMMHNYYFPLEIQQHAHFKSQAMIQNDEKKEKNLSSNKPEPLIRSSEEQRNQILGHSSKHPRGRPNFLADANYTSNTSLFNANNQIQNNSKDKQYIKENSQFENEQNFDSDQSQLNEGYQNEIQLKPKSSSKMPQNKANGKGLKQGLSRSVHMFMEQSSKPNEAIHSSSNRQQAIRPSYSPNKLKGHNVYSYNPKRKQFEIIEYDYYAQSMLAQLQFSEDDTEEEIQFKLKIIEEYNNRLDERIKRREFVIEHRLLDTQFMLKTVKKYNKHNFQIFQPFRRLINRNQDYYKVLESYNKMSKASSLAQGMIKVKRKLKSTQKNPQIKDFIEYLNKKKEKKQLLGKRARYQNETERRVLYKQASKINKKIILSVSQNSSSYANYQSNNQQGACLLSQQLGQATRTMTSRSEQRQRLKSMNHNPSRQVQHLTFQQGMNQNFNMSNLATNVQSNCYTNGNSIGMGTILSQEDIHTVQKIAKKEIGFGSYGIAEFKPVSLKNYTLKPLTIHHTQKN